MPTHPRYIAFWSYTRFDDKHDEKRLTGLRKALEAEVRALSGVRVEIFQDVDGIAWGERWKSKTKTSADDATYLIPIITPSYFKSDECRSELEQFVQREQDMGFSELILPLYYIESQLEDQFVMGTDRLARVVADHNYRDFRRLRHQNLKSFEVRQAVTSLATDLNERLKSFARWQLSSKKMEAQITAPVSPGRVPRNALILGTLRGVSEWGEVWLVVQTGPHYHPQAHLGRAGPWQATLTIGRSGDFDANREFAIHVLAVTQEASNGFDQYRKDAGTQKKWPAFQSLPMAESLRHCESCVTIPPPRSISLRVFTMSGRSE